MVAIETYEDFLQVHGILLAATGLPETLYPDLFLKLSSETFDGGHLFQIEPCEDGRQRHLICTADFIPKHANVFLVDHAWTFRLPDAPKQLEEVPGLTERMASLMCVDLDEDEQDKDTVDNVNDCNAKATVEELLEREISKAKETSNDGVKWLELEELHIDDEKLLVLDLPSRCPNLIALSLLGNKIRKVETILEEVPKFEAVTSPLAK